MRAQLAKVLSNVDTEDHFFLTGDLGFAAFEGLQNKMGPRFVNAGVAEQNMIGVAAGLAQTGFKVFVYSIAPFCYARPFEQVRNDICLHNLPVCLIGNGGGYAYGHMGPTHHALEDCAAMNAVGAKVIVPSFDPDIDHVINNIDGPTYLRLGYDQRPEGENYPTYAPWREVLKGDRGAIAALGPLAGVAWQALNDIPRRDRPSIWAVTEFDTTGMPEALLHQIQKHPLYILEEHYEVGGLGMTLCLDFVKKDVPIHKLIHRFATGYPTGRFGSQNYHRKECALDINGIRDMVLQGDYAF